MKKTIMILAVVFSLLLALTACNNEPSAGDEPAHPAGTEAASISTEPTQAAAPAYVPGDRAQASLCDHFIETAEGYYYRHEKLIYFCERGGDAFYPLCGKPNCNHSDSDCNAWCDCALGYYDGALYAVTLNNYRFVLVKLNPDGTAHEEVATISDKGGGYHFDFHHGKLYVLQGEGLEVPLEDRMHFIVIDLSDYARTEPLADYMRQGYDFSTICYYKDKIYAYSGILEKPEVTPAVVELNLSTGAVKELLHFQIGAAYATDDTFYYLEPDVGFKEYDLATDEIKDCGLPVADAFWATYDENYVFLMGHGRNKNRDFTLYFFTRDYQLLDQVELTDGVFYCYSSSDRLFFNRGHDKLIYYLDKSEIGSGHLALKPLNNP